MENKTNVMRILDKHKIVYRSYSYDGSKALSGIEVATALGQNPKQVFKTLVTVARSGQHYVFMLPVLAELDLKKAAFVVGEKALDMLKSKELLPLTGYIHGGCSPIGMKKNFKTVVHISAKDFATIIFSAGKIGFQVETAPEDLAKVTDLEFADITVAMDSGSHL